MEWNFGLLKENTSTNECAHAIVCVAIRKGQIRNKVIHDRVGVTPIEKKLVQTDKGGLGIYNGGIQKHKFDMGGGSKKGT